MTPPVGLVAGAGALPRELARRLRAGGRRVVCVQLDGDPAQLEELCDRHESVPVARALDALKVFEEERVRELVMAGKVDKLQALRGAAGVRELAGRRDGRDPELWRAVRRLLENRGFSVLAPAALVPDLVAQEGPVAGRAPTQRERDDLALGFRVARLVAAAGVGQAVAVRDGVVLAAEAAEGTDAMVRRCSAFGPGAVVVKVAWPQGDPGFDPPVVGPETLAAMREAGATALGVEAGATLLLDLPALRAAARQLDLAVVGLTP